MNDLIQRIVNAIIRQEGMPLSSTNPGNLRAAPWMQQQTIDHGYWKPISRHCGVAGAAHQVALDIARGYSLRELISAWAPPGDNNNTEAYIQNVSTWADIQHLDEPLWNFLLDV